MRRGRTARDVPPPLELECLRAIWDLGEANVQSVKDVLAPRRPLAYTTVMTMLERLTRKNMLSRRKVGRSFVYKPEVSRDEIRRRAVNDLVESLFEGDPSNLQRYLSEPTPPPQGNGPEGIGEHRPEPVEAVREEATPVGEQSRGGAEDKRNEEEEAPLDATLL